MELLLAFFRGSVVDKDAFKEMAIEIKDKIDINKQGIDSEPLLTKIASHSSDPGELIDFLFRNFKDINPNISLRWKTPMECAILRGNKKCAIALSKHQNIDIQYIFHCIAPCSPYLSLAHEEYLEQILFNAKPLNTDQTTRIEEYLAAEYLDMEHLYGPHAQDYVKKYMKNPSGFRNEMHTKASCQILCLCLLIENK